MRRLCRVCEHVAVSSAASVSEADSAAAEPVRLQNQVVVDPAALPTARLSAAVAAGAVAVLELDALQVSLSTVVHIYIDGHPHLGDSHSHTEALQPAVVAVLQPHAISQNIPKDHTPEQQWNACVLA